MAELVESARMFTTSIYPPTPRYAIPPYLVTKDLRDDSYLGSYLGLPCILAAQEKARMGRFGAVLRIKIDKKRKKSKRIFGRFVDSFRVRVTFCQNWCNFFSLFNFALRNQCWEPEIWSRNLAPVAWEIEVPVSLSNVCTSIMEQVCARRGKLSAKLGA